MKSRPSKGGRARLQSEMLPVVWSGGEGVVEGNRLRNKWLKGESEVVGDVRVRVTSLFSE